MREISRRNSGGATGKGSGARRRRVACRCRLGAARRVASGALRPRWQSRRRVFQSSALHRTLRNRRLCKARRCQFAARYTAPEGKVERGAVVRPRAPPLHARDSSEVPLVS